MQEPSTPVRESGVFVRFFLLFFSFSFLANWPFTVERYGCLCVASFKLLLKKIWLPNVMCFRRCHSFRMANACLKTANPRTESYTSFSRTPSVDRPYMYAFGAFPSSLWSLRGLRRSAFLFQLFFVSPLKQKWHKSVIRNDTKSVTSKPEHVRLFLLFDCQWSPTACQSMTFLQHVQDSSALSMLTKTYISCSQYQQ